MLFVLQAGWSFSRPQRVFFWTARAFSFWQNNRGPEKDFYLFSGHKLGSEKRCWDLKQDKPSARSGKRHFGVEKKSSPLQALPQAARIALHEQLRAPLELQGDSARNLALC